MQKSRTMWKAAVSVVSSFNSVRHKTTRIDRNGNIHRSRHLLTDKEMLYCSQK